MKKKREQASRVLEALTGDIVAIPLARGAYALVWILEATPDRNYTLLVLDGFWPELPDADAIANAPPAPSGDDVLLGYDNVWKGWFEGAVPADFRIVGKRAVSPTEERYVENYSGTMIFGTGERLREALQSAWREKYDRPALEAEWAAADATRNAQAAARREAITLEKMARERIFSHWSEHWPDRVVREARRIFRDATKELIAIEKSGTRPARAKILKRIVTEMNDLDAAEACIETSEREEIVARIDEIAQLVGLTNDDEALTGHRDW